MSTDYALDALIFGQGLSAFATAVTLRSREKKVALVAKSVGASALSSGAWDMGLHQQDLLWNCKQLSSTKNISDSAKQIADSLQKHLKIDFSEGKPYLLPTSAGTWRHAPACQFMQSGADLENIQNRRIALIGSSQWRWPLELIAKRLQQEAAKRNHPINLFPISLNFGKIKSNAQWGDVPLPAIATQLESSATFQETFLELVRTATHDQNVDFLLFPPLFLSPTLFNSFQAQLKTPLAECLATLEPTAGYRLNRAIEESLRELQIPLYQGREISFQASNGKVSQISFSTNTEPRTLAAASFILASGKLFGGGIHLGYTEIKESIFDLPVFCSQGSPSLAYRNQLNWNPTHFQDLQPWSKLGVSVDSQFRPVDNTGIAVYDNVHACGSILGGVDFAKSQMGLGFMAHLGRECALAIS